MRRDMGDTWSLQGLAMLNTQGDMDILWAGDMNWNAADGDPPLPAGWCVSPHCLSCTKADTHVAVSLSNLVSLSL